MIFNNSGDFSNVHITVIEVIYDVVALMQPQKQPKTN